MTILANQVLQDGLNGTEGWKKAEESMRLQETGPPCSNR
jgi:hypothetical protein